MVNGRFCTTAQAKVLRQIAQNGGVLCLTRSPEGDRYHDAFGITVREATARILIRNGWVIPQRDSMYDLSPQTWKVRTPSDVT